MGDILRFRSSCELGAAKTSRGVIAPLSITLLLFSSAVAMAQTSGDQNGSTPPNGGIETVVVTALGRSEDLMRTPDSISAFGSAEIDSLRLNEISDFASMTPNVKIVEEQDSATNVVFVRGIGSNRNQASSVAFVVDGVILPDPDAFTTDLSDAVNVEILKGPQGALYGKGALAGVINITTRKPSDEFYAQLKAGYESGSTFDAYGTVSGPIVEGKLVAMGSVKIQSSDGYYTNVFNHRPINPDNFYKLNTRVVFTPTSALTFDLNGSYYSQHAGNPPYTLYNLIGPSGTPPGPGNGGIIDSTVASTPIDHNEPDRSRRQIWSVSLVASYDTGVGILKSISAYDDIRFSMSQDLDFTPVPIATAAQDRNTSGWSQELRFTSPDDEPFRYIVGAYYGKTRRFLNTFATIDLCLLGLGGSCGSLPQIPSGIIIPLHLAQNTNYDAQYAGFAQFSYDITDRLHLTGAIRYDNDARSQNDALLTRIDRTTFSDWQPKASLSYELSEDSMFYATYAHGYKSGIFNVFNTVGGNKPLIVKPEKTDSVEVGTKDSFFDRRLLFTGAAFYTRYANAQEYSLDIQSGGQATVNVRKSRIFGVEAEVTARPIDRLDLDASYGYTNSKIQDFNGTSQYVGQPLPETPSFTLNLSAQYTYPIEEKINLVPRLDFTQYGRTVYQDFQNPNTNQLLIQRPYHTLDAQVALEWDNWALTVYGKNVTNEHYVTSAYSRFISALIFGVTGDIIHPAPGAIYGVELRANL